MKLTHKKIAILVEQLYQELEVWYPYYRFKEEGAKVYLLGPQKGNIYPSLHGYPAEAEKSIDDARADEKVLDSSTSGSRALARVWIEFRLQKNLWATVSVSRNIIEASLNALHEGLEYGLMAGAEK